MVNLSTKASSSAALRSPDDLSNDDDIAVGRRIVLIPGHGLFLRLRWHFSSCTQADRPALTEVRFLRRLSDFSREIRVEKLTGVRAQAVRSAQTFRVGARSSESELRISREQPHHGDEHEQSIPHPGALPGRGSLLRAPLAA